MYREEDIPPQAERAVSDQAWLITFADLVSLLLAFFVLLFSMSNVKIGAWENVVDTLSRSLNPARERIEEIPKATYNVASTFRKRAINLDYLAAVLEETVGRDPLLQRSKTVRLEDRMVLALPGELLFAPAQAVLSERALKALFSLGGVLRNVDNQVLINGYSDPTLPGSGEYASNWQLSLARAIAVANALKQAGYTEDIIAYGYADSRYGNLPKMSEARRAVLARRVDIVILPTAKGG